MDEYKRDSLLRIKKCEEVSIKKSVEKRGVRFLVHFTRMDNLSSILKHGFLPIDKQILEGIEANRNDLMRIDSMLHSTSFSVEFPNYKLFYRFRTYDYPGSKWVVISVNKDIIFSHCNISFFCKSNAAGLLFGVNNYDEFCTVKSFNSMFCNEFVKKDNTVIYRSALKLRNNYTTDPQAEILISDKVIPEYIDRICFYSLEDINEYKRNYGVKHLCKFKYQVDPSLFDARIDYMFW